MNGDRHNGYGSRATAKTRGVGKQLADTREQLAHQQASAAFTAAPPVKQWTCACGAVNPEIRDECRFCGEAKVPA